VQIQELLQSRFIPRDYIHDDKYNVGVSLADENLFGDFEDLEEEEEKEKKGKGKGKGKEEDEWEGEGEGEDPREAKARMKEAFDEDYDEQKKGNPNSEKEDQEAYFNDLKEKAEEQRKKNLEVCKTREKNQFFCHVGKNIFTNYANPCQSFFFCRSSGNLTHV
jgi:hypothetical protein